MKRFFDQPIFIPKLHINFAEFPYLLYFVLNRDFSSWEPVADYSTEWERVCFFLRKIKFEYFKGNNWKRNINNWIKSLYSNRLNEKVFLKMNLKSIFHFDWRKQMQAFAFSIVATFIRKDNSYSSFLLRNSNLKFNVANLYKEI